MSLSWETAQTAAITLAAYLGLRILESLIHANVVRWAEQIGLDSLLTRSLGWLPARVRRMIAGWPEMRRRWWLWLCLGLSLGLGVAPHGFETIGSWLHPESTSPASPPQQVASSLAPGAATTPTPGVTSSQTPRPQMINPTSSLKAAKEWPATAPYDIPKKLELIDRVRSIYNSEMQQAISRLMLGMGDWKQAIAQKNSRAYTSRLGELVGSVALEQNNIARIKEANKQYAGISEILDLSYMEPLIQATTKLNNDIAAWDDATGNAYYFINPDARAWDKGLEDFQRGINKVDNALLERRRELERESTSPPAASPPFPTPPK